jgi:hypothetical protein
MSDQKTEGAERVDAGAGAKESAEPLVVLCDTREQKPPPFPDGVTRERRLLKEGDYSSLLLVDIARIERKSCSDFASTITGAASGSTVRSSACSRCDGRPWLSRAHLGRPFSPSAAVLLLKRFDPGIGYTHRRRWGALIEP